jgi:hypothetical protein
MSVMILLSLQFCCLMCDIKDDAVVPAAAAISDPYCVGCPVVTFIPAVACVPAVVSSHDIAVILAVDCCLRGHCCYLHPNCDRYSCCCWDPFTS